MRTVLITGGAGFIGFHLASRLLRAEVSVRLLDNLDPYYDPGRKQRNIGDLTAKGGSAVTFLQGDIRKPEDCRRAVEGVDGIVHLAALAGVRPSIREPARYMDVNVVGTQTLLQAIDRADVPVVFGSSSSVYGGRTEVPFRESDSVDRPVSPYAASKKAGELICHAFHHLRGNPVSCLRFFTVYGPRQRPDMAIARFSRALVAAEPLAFFGDGSTRRDYTYVEDIVDGIEAALRRARGFEVYNLGGADTTSLAGLVAHLEETFGRKAVLERLPDQPGDVPITSADVSKASRDLAYRPQTSLADGLRKFADWYLAERSKGTER